jgi:hypothetical protein
MGLPLKIVVTLLIDGIENEQRKQAKEKYMTLYPHMLVPEGMTGDPPISYFSFDEYWENLKKRTPKELPESDEVTLARLRKAEKSGKYWNRGD